jgi:4'-phosphopantetheinyl transferase EntD
MPAGKRDFVFAIAFSVRESVYKCLNPVYGKWIDHKDAKIDVSSISEGKVDLTVAGYNDMGPLVCRYIEHYPYIITSAVLYGGFSPVKLNS